MKTITLSLLLQLFLLVGIQSLDGQELHFSKQDADTEFEGPGGIYMADLNDDGRNDIVAASIDANTIAWWESSQTKPYTWTRHTVDNEFVGAVYVYADDIDNDGLQDLLGAGYYGNEIAWWHNEGGSPLTWVRQTIASNYTHAHEVRAADVDLDGDLDVLAASASLHVISWFENDGNYPVSWTRHDIGLSFSGARSIDAADYDGDGDIDVTGAALQSNEIAWWENDGSSPPSWTKHSITTSFSLAHSVHATDIDLDGDADILATGYSAGVSWWRNDGGDPLSWEKQTVSTLNTAVIAWAVDLDQDGDKDIACSAQDLSRVVMYENDGDNTLSWNYRLVDNTLSGSWPLHYGDLDGDLDIDLVSGGNYDNTIRWYENYRTGSFETVIPFQGESRFAACFVPEDYNPGLQHKLIVGLHYCGTTNIQSAKEYRDLLTTLPDSLQAIILCPDCNNLGPPSYAIGDPEIIPAAAEAAVNMYNVDETFIYLTGGSCNGKSTLKQGMENIYGFRGIIPFNAWLPEVPDDYFNYDTEMTVCICSGTLDPSYDNNVKVYDSLVAHGALARLNAMPGIAHEFFFPTFDEEMMECIGFIDSVASVITTNHPVNASELNIRLYPNPTAGKASIVLESDGPTSLEMDLLTVDGRIAGTIFRGKINGGMTTFKADLEHFKESGGLYILRFRTQGEITYTRVMLQ
jgi:hypothetical protein